MKTVPLVPSFAARRETCCSSPLFAMLQGEAAPLLPLFFVGKV